MTKAFLSYSRKDKNIAERLTIDLEKSGVNVWFDEFEIKIGENIAEKINEGLKGSEFFLLLMSKSSISSNWVNYELRNFSMKEKKVILILLEDVELDKNHSYQIVDFRKSYSEGITNLKAQLKNKSIYNLNSEDRTLLKDLLANNHYNEDNKAINIQSKPIPELSNKGFLPEGLHTASFKDFVLTFTRSDARKKYRKALINIFNFAKSKNAKYLLFGGSFITAKSIPSDIDCIIVFEEAIDIPSSLGKFFVDNTILDIYYASQDDPNTVNTHINFLSTNHNGQKTGLIKIWLSDDSEKYLFQNIKIGQKTEFAKVQSEKINIFQPRGILVTVHGLFSKAEWNTQIAPIASSQGWIFTPYVYKTNWPDLLIRGKKRKKVVNEFRDWIFDMQTRYKEVPISIIGHSFGTHIIAEYLDGFDNEIPVRFQSIILTGSIIHIDYDWTKHYLNSKIVRVRNEVAKNDNWIQKIPEGYIKLDRKFGKSGVQGFSNKSSFLTEPKNKIFDHNNVIRRDVVEKLWMPYLNANANLDYLT